VKLTRQYYEDLGYYVTSVEKDNAGWDLEATIADTRLRIEVKGLSQKELLVELTPNEYEKMRGYLDSYRLSVVTDALGEEPVHRIFAFSPDSGKWEDSEGDQLVIEEIIGAKMSVRPSLSQHKAQDEAVSQHHAA